jgi:methyl-accepting chemotaxis protein
MAKNTGVKNGKGGAAGAPDLAPLLDRAAGRIGFAETSARALVHSQEELAATLVRIVDEASATAASNQEMEQSIQGVKRDAQVLAETSESTAATLEETARSIKGVSTTSEQLSWHAE